MKFINTVISTSFLLLFSIQAQAYVFTGTIGGAQSGTLEYNCDINYDTEAKELVSICEGVYNNYSNIPGFSLDGELSFSVQTAAYVTTIAFDGGPITITTLDNQYVNSFDNLAFWIDGPNNAWSISGGYIVNGEYTEVNNDLDALMVFTLFFY